VVVGETRDQAAHAGTLIEVEISGRAARRVHTADTRDAVVPPQRMWPLASSSGDAGKAIADSPVKIETVDAMPDRDHSPRVKHVLDRILPYTTVQLDRCPASSRQESLLVLEGRAGMEGDSGGTDGRIDNPAACTAFTFDLHRASSAGFEKKDRRDDQKQPDSLAPRRPLPENSNGQEDRCNGIERSDGRGFG
jgi:hypothetical protein